LQSGELAAVKSKTSRRVVSVGQVVIDELPAHLARFPSDDALFTDDFDRPLSYATWKVIWKPAAEKMDVDATAHHLRHLFASALISGGASVKQVQTVLGHSSAVITLRTYAHLWPGDDDRTRDVVDAVLSPLADSVRTEAVSDG
jgi:integrase